MLKFASSLTTSYLFDWAPEEPGGMTLLVAEDDKVEVELGGTSWMMAIGCCRDDISVSYPRGEVSVRNLDFCIVNLNNIGNMVVNLPCTGDKLLAVNLGNLGFSHEIRHGSLAGASPIFGVNQSVAGCSESIVSVPTGDPEVMTVSRFFPKASEDYLACQGAMLMLVLSGYCTVAYFDGEVLTTQTLTDRAVLIADQHDWIRFVTVSPTCEILMVRRGNLYDGAEHRRSEEPASFTTVGGVKHF